MGYIYNTYVVFKRLSEEITGFLLHLFRESNSFLL